MTKKNFVLWQKEIIEKHQALCISDCLRNNNQWEPKVYISTVFAWAAILKENTRSNSYSPPGNKDAEGEQIENNKARSVLLRMKRLSWEEENRGRPPLVSFIFRLCPLLHPPSGQETLYCVAMKFCEEKRGLD